MKTKGKSLQLQAWIDKPENTKNRNTDIDAVLAQVDPDVMVCVCLNLDNSSYAKVY